MKTCHRCVSVDQYGGKIKRQLVSLKKTQKNKNKAAVNQNEDARLFFMLYRNNKYCFGDSPPPKWPM